MHLLGNRSPRQPHSPPARPDPLAGLIETVAEADEGVGENRVTHLVLSRKAREGVVLVIKGTTVRVVAERFEPGKVALGVWAPRDVAVHREEVYQAIAGREPAA